MSLEFCLHRGSPQKYQDPLPPGVPKVALLYLRGAFCPKISEREAGFRAPRKTWFPEPPVKDWPGIRRSESLVAPQFLRD
ncbi:MAG: hypothetical protein AB7S80_18935 [Rhizobiaceae bacterium]